MFSSLLDAARVIRRAAKSSKVLVICAALWLALSVPARAHEVLPSIIDMELSDGKLFFNVELNLEGFVAGIDLATTTDTNATAQAATYDDLHQLDPASLEQRFRAFWPQMAPRIIVQLDDTRLTPDLTAVSIPEVGNPDIPRTSRISFAVAVPDGAKAVQVGWAESYGAFVLRQMGVDMPYDGFVAAGAMTDPITLAGGGQVGLWQTFVDYIPVGFDHIVPKGLDHILFVLGLFFLSTRLRPLLLQVSAFTVAHTVTLALGALGYVNIPGSIVEPIIAASIVYVAVENILTDGLSRWRPLVVFCFGLLHGLGFASVLGEFGLPENAFIPALLGFNLGVEFGQLAVIAVAFGLVGYWFRDKPWYRKTIAIPASCGIAAVGAYWVVERVFF